jgi:chemotaxis protein histidine kinase CheA
MITPYKDHPLSEILPLMSDEEIAELATDIQQNTQRAPITLYEGKILDGRNRYRACRLANVEPKVRHFTSGDALAFIVSANVFRRHLTTSQRALVAAKLSNLSNGQHKASSAILPSSKPPVTQAEAAKELNVSERSVHTAKEVLREAPKKEVKAIERGEKTVATVARETKQKAEAKEKHFDKTGYPIPETILSDWNDAESFHEVLGQLHRMKLRIQKAVEESDIAFREITNSTVADLENVWRDLQRVLPYAVCPTCQGRTRSKCTLCRQRGFISRFGYDHWIPKKTREIREKAIKK